MEKTFSSKKFRIIALLEGISFLLILFVTMPLKYFADQPEPNQQVGMAHGILFIAYIIFAIEVKVALDWSYKKLFIALGASVVPFGTFFINKKWIHGNNR